MWAVAAARESAGRERICIVIESSTGQHCSVLLLGIWFLGLYTKHGATQWPHQSKGPWPTSKSFSLYLFLGSRWTKPDSHCSSAGGVTGGERRKIQVIWLAPLSFMEGQRRPETGIPISWKDSRRPPVGATLALEPSLGFVCCAPGLGGWELPKEHREGRMWPGLSEAPGLLMVFLNYWRLVLSFSAPSSHLEWELGAIEASGEVSDNSILSLRAIKGNRGGREKNNFCWQ